MINRIKELRKRKGYTQTELAQKVNVNRAYLSLLESGKKNLKRKLIDALCRELECKESDLLEKEINYEMKDEYVEYAMEIVDNATRGMEIDQKEKAEILGQTYKRIYDFLESEFGQYQYDQIKKEYNLNTSVGKLFLEFAEKKLTKS